MTRCVSCGGPTVPAGPGEDAVCAKCTERAWIKLKARLNMAENKKGPNWTLPDIVKMPLEKALAIVREDEAEAGLYPSKEEQDYMPIPEDSEALRTAAWTAMVAAEEWERWRGAAEMGSAWTDHERAEAKARAREARAALKGGRP